MYELKEKNKLGDVWIPWNDGLAKTVTFIVTKDCQLRCKYCYMIGKNDSSKMDFEIAKKTIDYLLKEKEIFREKAVIWEFIGGEPFLEIELIDKICDYIKIRMYEEQHDWFNDYRFNISTNGLLYHSSKVQEFIRKNQTHISIGITLDGTKQKHDLQRIYPNGKGSYEDVLKNIPLWLKQFPDTGTKATIAKADLPYIKESVISLWELGIKDVYINVVFEDVWNDGDDLLFEEQLNELGDYIIEHELYKDNNFSFFSKLIGKPLDPARDNQNWCGAGHMLAVDSRGNYYPCVRFADYSLRNKRPLIIGNCFEGIDQNKLRPFLSLDRTIQSPQECISCEVASGCAWCQAENYDSAETDTIFQRATFICKMHKARVRANNKFWEKLDNIPGKE